MHQLQFDWLNEWQADDAFIRALRGGFDLANEIRISTSHPDREELIGYPPPVTCREYT